MRHLRPRKSFGQAFLTHEPTADALVDALGAGPNDTVLEIGPGKGILTRRLLARARSVVAVEIDPRLVEGLHRELRGIGKLELVWGDFMTFDLGGYRGLRVMGNLPYNLSSQMVFRLLESAEHWDRAVLTTQREFAERLLGVPGTKAYGALTVFFERLTEREKLFNIAPSCFKPSPDVISTAFRLVRRGRPLFEVADEDLFRRVVKACFVQRRKTIVNNLAAGLGLSKEPLSRMLDSCGIDPGHRAETLTAAQFKMLTDALASDTEAIVKLRVQSS
jgi:16S rRNA (adenine1518-N6/adenine1519-N6)-dimethyltransferase